jgi:hypothetical protein
VGDLQPSAAAAERGLDGDRETVLLGESKDLVSVGDRFFRAGHQRRTGSLGDVPGRHLVTEVADGLRWRPDPDQPRVEHGLGEVGVLGKESVAGVDCVGTGAEAGVDDFLDDQVRVGGRVATEREGLVRHADVQRIPVGLGIDRDGAVARITAGPYDADRDLAAVGHQHLADHRALRSTRISPLADPTRPDPGGTV